MTGLLAGIAIVIGSFLPWLSATGPFGISVSRSGLDGGGGDGYFTLGAGALLAFISARVALGRIEPSTRAGIGMGILALIAIGVGVADMADVNNRISNLGAYAFGSVGIGLWIIVIAGSAGMLGGIATAASKHGRFSGQTND